MMRPRTAHSLAQPPTRAGDHRISEAEFLDWISRFIRVSDSSAAGQQEPQEQTRADREQPRAGRRRLQALAGGTGASRVARSSTAASSLAAQPSEAPRARRGSGSGLALMRSLSSSAAADGPGGGGSSSASGSGSPGALEPAPTAAGSPRPGAAPAQPDADPEARNDLRAAFGVFDLDGDGYITVDEVRAGLKLLGESWSPAELQNVFSKCPSAGAGGSGDLSGQRISIDDFVRLLL